MVLCGCELAVQVSRNLRMCSELEQDDTQFFRISLCTALRTCNKLQFSLYYASTIGNAPILEYVDHGDTF